MMFLRPEKDYQEPPHTPYISMGAFEHQYFEKQVQTGLHRFSRPSKHVLMYKPYKRPVYSSFDIFFFSLDSPLF